MTERLTFTENNHSQQYATHDYFRYFGKLPPVVVRHILETAAVPSEPFLDLMCGSGTSLVEANLMGVDAVGVDVNPLSVLISRVKVTPVNVEAVVSERDTLMSAVTADTAKLSENDIVFADTEIEYLNAERPTFPNKSYWFLEQIEARLIILRHHINRIEDDKLRDFFNVAFFSIIRRASNASTRPGRIFRIKDPKPVDVYSLFVNKVSRMIEGMKEFKGRCTTSLATILQEDARSTSLPDEQFGFVLNHPPYFALYKYSSDVLRFELEWGGFPRRKISQQEVREGFKTTDIGVFDDYADDMTDLFAEAYRLLKPGRQLCVVVNNSTLGEVRLPVVNTFIERASRIGFNLADHYIRDVMFSQARYHRSANENIQTKQDHLLFFQK